MEQAANLALLALTPHKVQDHAQIAQVDAQLALLRQSVVLVKEDTFSQLHQLLAIFALLASSQLEMLPLFALLALQDPIQTKEIQAVLHALRVLILVQAPLHAHHALLIV